jgi:hypothetical protein
LKEKQILTRKKIGHRCDAQVISNIAIYI